MWKKTFSLIGVLLLFGGGYFIFDRYTGSPAFVKKDVDALNKSYAYSSDEFRRACEDMSTFSHVDGLSDGAFIPFGGRTYYYRSYCFQELARQTVNENLCVNVRKRWTLLGDGSGVSAVACRQQVERAREAQAQRENESKNALEQKKQFLASDPMKITKTWVEKLTDDQWRVSVQVEGSLFGQYKFEVRALNINTKYGPIVENSLLQSKSRTLSWTIKRSDIVATSDMLPKIVPISVVLTYSDSGEDTSIGNTSISIE